MRSVLAITLDRKDVTPNGKTAFVTNSGSGTASTIARTLRMPGLDRRGPSTRRTNTGRRDRLRRARSGVLLSSNTTAYVPICTR
jgi:hypothetical protein